VEERRNFDGYLADRARSLETPILTSGETAVVFLLSHGVPRERAAEWLHISPETLPGRLATARLKLNASSAAHVVATALRLGLID
jgi:DNA-binding CsgD family transcriptional regulator